MSMDLLVLTEKIYKKICLGGVCMKRLVTAMGNDILNNELKKYSKYDLVSNDLFCQDMLITCISKCEVDTIIISGLLQGQWDLEEFVSKIRKENSFARVIIVIDEIDATLRKVLEKSNVFDIFLDSNVEVQDIIEAIDREDPIVKKYAMVNEDVEKYTVIDKNLQENQSCISKKLEKLEKKEKLSKDVPIVLEKMVQKQEVITISGIPGAGKSTFATNFCKVLSEKSASKILLIDLDTLNGNIDEILKVEKVPKNIEICVDPDKKSGINYVSELIMKNRFNANVFDELVINSYGYDILTGNTSLHYCQNVLNDKCYDELLKCAKEKYDFIVIDTSSNVFLDSTKWALANATRILFITESNFLSLKKMSQFISIMTKTWGIWKQKIELVVNKKSKNCIENEVISEALDGMKIVGEIKFNEENNSVSYENILANINYVPKKKIIEKLLEIKKSFFAGETKIEKEMAVDVN